MTAGLTIARAIENKQTIHISLNQRLSRLERVYVVFFGLFLNLLIINDLVRVFFSSNGRSIAFVQYLTYGVGLIFSLFYLIFSKREGRAKVTIFVFSLILGAITALSILRLNALEFFVENYFTVLFSRCLPAFILIMLINGETAEALLNNLLKYRFLWIAYAIIAMIYISSFSSYWGSSYAGNYGFNLLLPFALCFYCFMKKCRELQITEKSLKKKRRLIKLDIIRWLIYAVALLIFISLRGSRSAFLCGFAFIFFAFFFSGIVPKGIRQVLFLVLLILGILAIVFFKQITDLLVEMFPSSRTIHLLVDGFTADSGRFGIWEIFLKDLKKDPIIFRGLFSDRFFYSINVKKASFVDPTNYPHNFVIEVLYQFGYLFGIILLFFLTVLCFRTAFILDKKRFQNCSLSFLFYFFFIGSVVRLMLTSSYVSTFEFYAFLGIAFKINLLAKQKMPSYVIRL